MRAGREPSQFVFASFDGASDVGLSLIASDLANELRVDASTARAEALRMVAAANHRGDELVVSLMVTKDVLVRMLSASTVDTQTRAAVRLWLDVPLVSGQLRVVAVAGEEIRASAVDSATEIEDPAPVPMSMLN